ncbi:capsule biosynthesis protein [Eilatimonas milleporae]|uniref:Capsular polysaccharide export protein n=1 Tax=Eilatimonas milleporae TaxID=911205 RepID=A0A3M0CU04_9PROT|nr:capsular biosynthesis protein [Eilatimonas milleporae]RMB12465.1 capsular polysaccharide export protein [Eilatimonas milleporae]
MTQHRTLPQPQRHGPHGPDGKHTVLILQGLGTPFLKRLADKLVKQGHHVIRVNFCGGDWVFGDPFGPLEHIDFRGRANALAGFYQDLIATRAITDIILFGDCRPIHVPARQAARDAGIDVYVLEEGYIRPGWITLEHFGTNANSALPRTADRIQALAAQAPPRPDPPHLPPPMRPRVIMDLTYKLFNILGFPFFPHYRTHRPYLAATEMTGWLKRLSREPFFAGRRKRLLHSYEAASDYYLVPLQLNADIQIRRHSRYGGVPDFIEDVMGSFCKHGRPDTRLLFKNHPLDNGVINYRRLIREKARALDLDGRVDFVDGGDLNRLLDGALGVVLVNSTSGLTAMSQGVPVKALGQAIYDLPGLADQNPLSKFWQAPTPPDKGVFETFRHVVETYTQIQGCLFTAKGIDIGTDKALEVVTGHRPRVRRSVGNAAVLQSEEEKAEST